MVMDPSWISQALAQISAQTDQKINAAAAGVRRAVGEQVASNNQRVDKALADLASIARGLQITQSGAGVTRIENIPGRRVPYDYLVDIPIGEDVTSIREASMTISQEGPFVAVRRFATFQSAFEFQIGSPDGNIRFSGRSYGRYRPIHSAWDLHDAGGGVVSSVTNPFPANMSMVGGVELTSATSGFRTMEFDGRILVEDAGSGYPRQNMSVPTPFWTTQINSPQDLAALDFFERGSVITFKVQPNHVNNPAAGSASGDYIFGSAGWPFLEGQYDKHEGIVTVDAFSTNGATPPVVTRITSDTVTRLPVGILTIGYLGYRIQQPIGPLG